MNARLAADLEIPTPQALSGVRRTQALRSRRHTIASLCARANVRYRVTGGKHPRVAFWDGPGHGHTVTDSNEPIYIIDRASLPQSGPDRALRALEILAYGFQDYASRESVCNRGYFLYPVIPDHGRLWLSEIGRRGGRSRSEHKAASSRRNLSNKDVR